MCKYTYTLIMNLGYYILYILILQERIPGLMSKPWRFLERPWKHRHCSDKIVDFSPEKVNVVSGPTGWLTGKKIILL